jgi:hypothetical protein
VSDEPKTMNDLLREGLGDAGRARRQALEARLAGQLAESETTEPDHDNLENEEEDE